MNVDLEVTKLIKKIDNGGISKSEVIKQIDRLERFYGAFDLLYDVCERDDPDYYEELKSDALIGLYNRNSLLKMAEIRCREEKALLSGTNLLIVGVTVVVLVIAIVLAKTGGKT